MAAFAEESRKKLFVELSGLQPLLEEAERLRQRCQDLEWERDFLLKKLEEVVVLFSEIEAIKLEKAKLVRGFLPSAVKKLFESEHFNQALGDLHKKAITFGSIFDEAAEAFYKLEFPYISLLAKKAGQSLEELVAVKAPSI
ncbi:hypothetical protein Tco_0999676 [Tanacetum coccineum]